MSQRMKAREFMRKEGHGDQLADVNVKLGDKAQVKHPHHLGRPAMAKSHQTFDGGEMGQDGLLRGHVKDV